MSLLIPSSSSQLLPNTPIEYYNKEPIFTTENESKVKYNGRINVSEPEDENARFKMFEKISIKNKSTEYRESLTNVWENNVLAQVFFSSENIQIIQNAMRKGVYDMSKGEYGVPNQNIDSLKIIMRSTYLQYAEHHPTNITEQVERLNTLVLDYAVPFVYNEAKFYVKYLNDQSTLVVPFQKCAKNDRVYKQLEPKFWF
jgi:hypothetical protein